MYGRGCPADTGGAVGTRSPEPLKSLFTGLVCWSTAISKSISLCVELSHLFKYFLKQSFSIGLLFHKTMMIDQN